jgi:flagella basal body P-ring formation protein FlgA
LWALCLAVGLGGAARAGEPEAGPVAVTLRASAAVTESPVCVRHVASLSGGTVALRDRIGNLDLADRPKPGKPLSLLRELVAYRIQVAGIERDRFRVQGADVVRVTPGSMSFTEDDYFQAARDALLERLALPAEDVIVSQAVASSPPQMTLSPRDEARLQAILPEPVNVPGRLRIDVALVINGQRAELVPLVVDVKLYQSVALAARAIPSGDVLSEDNVRFERRAVEAANSCLTQKDVKAGQKARRTLPAGQVIPQSAVDPVTPDNPILVRQRELVKVVARVGALRVTALAEAEQDGRAGDPVRVRNVDSKKELTGRVAGRGVVEVEY